MTHRARIQTYAAIIAISTWAGLSFPERAQATPTPPTNAILEDDILAVVDLPLAAELAAKAGMTDEEIQETVDIAQSGGIGPALTNELLVQESQAVKLRGKKKGFPAWVMQRWLAGVRGVDLKKEVEKRPDTPPLDPKTRAQAKSKLNDVRKKRLERRRSERNALFAQRKAGKKVKLRGRARHERLVGQLPGRPKPLDTPQDHPSALGQGADSDHPGHGRGRKQPRGQRPAHLEADEGHGSVRHLDRRKDPRKKQGKRGKPAKGRGHSAAKTGPKKRAK